MKKMKMLTKKTILQCLTSLRIDSSIEISKKDLNAKIDIIYEHCKEFEDDDFKKATNQIIREGTELYGKLPKTALFLEKCIYYKKELPTKTPYQLWLEAGNQPKSKSKNE